MSSTTADDEQFMRRSLTTLFSWIQESEIPNNISWVRMFPNKIKADTVDCKASLMSHLRERLKWGIEVLKQDKTLDEKAAPQLANDEKLEAFFDELVILTVCYKHILSYFLQIDKFTHIFTNFHTYYHKFSHKLSQILGV